ncbi:hypothetical protein AZE42_08275 [Rhizopogon vesiculosus]|uniref:Amino acid permease/ SLC12A domain-containing protein n=1 Tax=Rhizopogon vesiculosus TaxID=180088 RepID=A0A1J8QFE2_9AGAM|nr:hypothetical protein AZE42_08275 [Rhizopogon vesiculosus]
MSLKDDSNVDAAAREGLQKLGYKQEMKRYIYCSVSLLDEVKIPTELLVQRIRLAIMAVPYGLAAPIATSLVAGGPVVIIWGWILVSVLTQTLALSLAEICSKYPTSAGAYYWCYRLASPRTRVLASWINGWLTVVGVWTIALSVTFGTAQLVVAGVGIYYPEWIATPWQTCKAFSYIIFLGVIAVASIFCLFFNEYLPSIDIICACWTGLGIIVILICLSVKAAAGRRHISFALGNFDPSFSGWTPGWSFFIGLLPWRHNVSKQPAYTYAGIGLTASMAEEVHNPSEILPRAITWSIPISALSGVVFLLPILFTLPDVTALIQVSSGQPIGVMFTLIMGSRAGGFWLAVYSVVHHIWYRFVLRNLHILRRFSCNMGVRS